MFIYVLNFLKIPSFQKFIILYKIIYFLQIFLRYIFCAQYFLQKTNHLPEFFDYQLVLPNTFSLNQILISLRISFTYIRIFFDINGFRLRKIYFPQNCYFSTKTVRFPFPFLHLFVKKFSFCRKKMFFENGYKSSTIVG